MIKQKLEQNGQIITNEIDLLDLSLEVMKKYFSIQDKNYYEGNSNEIFDTAINEILKEKFNIESFDNPISIVNENKHMNVSREHGENSLKSLVLKKLSLKDIREKALEKLPIEKRRQNKTWKLSNGQIYRIYFGTEYANQKETIIRYIKSFRSESTNK